MFLFLEYAVHDVFSHADTAQSCAISQKDFLKEFDPANPSSMYPQMSLEDWDEKLQFLQGFGGE
jgi:hypothetical protein